MNLLKTQDLFNKLESKSRFWIDKNLGFSADNTDSNAENVKIFPGDDHRNELTPCIFQSDRKILGNCGNNKSFEISSLSSSSDVLLDAIIEMRNDHHQTDYSGHDSKRLKMNDSSSYESNTITKKLINDEQVNYTSLELSTSDFPKETESSSSSPPSSLPKSNNIMQNSSEFEDNTKPSGYTRSDPSSLGNVGNSSMNESDSDYTNSLSKFERNSNGFYTCHICNYSGPFHAAFKAHLQTHYDFHCSECDYTSRTEGRLKRHMKDFHSEVPPENFSGKQQKMMKPKLQKCKQCDFITDTKEEFWAHQRSHIKMEKLLECDKCNFVTEYKHHLEYHVRNHSGSKPYKCLKCNYECVNKSMLNSHMKSHTNVYQYRCSDCNYATKYCHSLKLHLQKLSHKPDVVLNSDGSLPEYDNSGELMSIKRGPNAHSNPNNKASTRNRSTSLQNKSNNLKNKSQIKSTQDNGKIGLTSSQPNWPFIANLMNNGNNFMGNLFQQQLMKMSLNFFMNSKGSHRELGPTGEVNDEGPLSRIPNQCRICLQNYPSLDELFLHLKEHVQPIRDEVETCKYCNYKCFGKTDHSYHVQREHSDKL